MITKHNKTKTYFFSRYMIKLWRRWIHHHTRLWGRISDQNFSQQFTPIDCSNYSVTFQAGPITRHSSKLSKANCHKIQYSVKLSQILVWLIAKSTNINQRPVFPPTRACTETQSEQISQKSLPN